MLLGSIANWIDPRPKADASPVPATPVEGRRSGKLGRATGPVTWSGRARSAGTIGDHRDHVERLLIDWLDQPLSTLGTNPAPTACKRRPGVRYGASKISRAITPRRSGRTRMAQERSLNHELPLKLHPGASLTID